nr:ESPR domain-containing protein [Neisseria uirgultaei]
MNKIYRIIWNSALNAWVVVSELTRNHTKRASATAAVAVLATLLSATAQASTNGSGGVPYRIPNLTLITQVLQMIIKQRMKVVTLITSLVLLLWIRMERQKLTLVTLMTNRDNAPSQ